MAQSQWCLRGQTRAATADDEPRRKGDSGEEDDDDDDDEGSLSLAAMEAELKPQVLKPSTASSDYEKLRKLQDQHVESACRTRSLLQPGEALQSAQDEIIEDVKSLSLNNNRIEALVEQLYAINKR
jgi:RNA polymerase primary sigma factor